MAVNFRRSVIIAELLRHEVARSGNFVSNICVFSEKRPLMVNFFKFCSESLHGDTDRCCCVQMSYNSSDGKSVRSCVIRMTEKISAPSLSNCHYCADRAQNLPESAPNIWLTRFLISSKSVHFRPNALTSFFCPVEYFQYSPDLHSYILTGLITQPLRQLAHASVS